MRHSAQEHGYKSFLWFGLVRLKDHWLNNWSMRAPWGGVRKWLQRKRGVKIGKNVHWGTHVVVDYPYPNFVVVEDGGTVAEGYITKVVVRVVEDKAHIVRFSGYNFWDKVRDKIIG